MRRVAWGMFGALLVLSLAMFVPSCYHDDDDGGGGTGEYITVTEVGGATENLEGAIGFGAYYTAHYPPISALSTALMAGAPGGYPMAVVAFNDSQAGTFDIGAYEGTFTWINSGGTTYGAMGFPVGSGTITVTTYGAVGERIEGTFNIVANEFSGGNPTGTTAQFTGSFSLIREADDYEF